MYRSAPNVPAARYSSRAYSQLLTRSIMPTGIRSAREETAPPIRRRQGCDPGPTMERTDRGAGKCDTGKSDTVSSVIGVTPDNTLSCRLLAWEEKPAGRTLPATDD